MTLFKNRPTRPSAARVARISPGLPVLAALAILAAGPAKATVVVTSQFQVSLTIVCSAQDEWIQCGEQRYSARKDTVALPAATPAPSELSTAPGAAFDVQPRLLTTITY